jgi:hypothetical protein
MQKSHKESKSELSPELDDLLERVISGKEKVTVYNTPEDYLKHGELLMQTLRWCFSPKDD